MTIDDFLRVATVAEPSTFPAVQTAEEDLGIQLPRDYVEFVLRGNGAEGPVPNRGYLALWPVEVLRSRNEEYAVAEFAPGLLLFGSDGADTAYAFDSTNSMKIVELPFIGMSREEMEFVANTFTEFLQLL